jgi:coproporphyrinogen III oxidase
MVEKTKKKNIKISDRHHDMLKKHCEKNGLKVYRLIEKWIDEYCKPKVKDLYGE